MIIYKQGNLLDENADAMVNTVNCVGVMGRGIALQFKKQFPENFKLYAAACKRGEVVPGSIFVYKTDTITTPRFILNFPTRLKKSMVGMSAKKSSSPGARLPWHTRFCTKKGGCTTLLRSDAAVVAALPSY